MNTAVAKKPSAWELECELLQSMLDVIHHEGPIPDELAQRVVECMEGAEPKRDALAGARKRLAGDIAVLYERASDAEAKAARARQALERLDAYILSLLDLQGVKRLDGAQYKIGWRQNPDSVQVDEEFYLHNNGDSGFVRVIPPDIQADKKAIAEALKQGKAVRGARLVEGSRRIVIS